MISQNIIGLWTSGAKGTQISDYKLWGFAMWYIVWVFVLFFNFRPIVQCLRFFGWSRLQQSAVECMVEGVSDSIVPANCFLLFPVTSQQQKHKPRPRKIKSWPFFKHLTFGFLSFFLLLSISLFFHYPFCPFWNQIYFNGLNMYW